MEVRGESEQPADDASRGLSPKSLLSDSRWLCGPSFLWENHDSWQDSDNETCELSPEDKEVKKTSTFSTTVKESFNPLGRRLEYFSDWFRAKRAVANCLKYLRILRHQVQRKKSTSSSSRSPTGTTITVLELQEAEQVILKEIQRQSYSSEVKELEVGTGDNTQDSRAKRCEVKGKSDLHHLYPFIDPHGVMRVCGRLKNASIDYGLKHPIIIPKASLIAKHSHEAIQHQGRGITLNEIRSSGYWIVSGGPVVSRLIHDCVTCRASSQEQKMADLPSDHLEPTPPFTYSAVDYFGPWIIKEGRKELKRYGVLFTCL